MTGQAPTDGQSGSRPWAMMDKLYQQFDIRTLGLASTEIPAEVSVLMLVHPKQLSNRPNTPSTSSSCAAASCWPSSTL